MKKMIIAATMFITVSAFANEVKNINPKVLHSFKTEFSTAQKVVWTASPDFYRASFEINDRKVVAYYTTDGELIGLTRNISSAQLPVHLQGSIKNNYSDYWISDLFEVSNNNGTSYYVTLEDGENKLVLTSEDGSDWSTYKKDRKI